VDVRVVVLEAVEASHLLFDCRTDLAQQGVKADSPVLHRTKEDRMLCSHTPLRRFERALPSQHPIKLPEFVGYYLPQRQTLSSSRRLSRARDRSRPFAQRGRVLVAA
jgi:hypothetical protein